MNFENYALATFVLIGLVNGINLAVEKNWKSFIGFMLATIAGTAFGYLKWFGLPGIEMGLALGINSSGIYKVAQKLGNS